MVPVPSGEVGSRHVPLTGGASCADWVVRAHALGPAETERRKWLSTALRGLVIYEKLLQWAIWTRSFRKHILCGGTGSVGALPERRRVARGREEGGGEEGDWGRGNTEKALVVKSDRFGYLHVQTL